MLQGAAISPLSCIPGRIYPPSPPTTRCKGKRSCAWGVEGLRTSAEMAWGAKTHMVTTLSPHVCRCYHEHNSAGVPL